MIKGDRCFCGSCVSYDRCCGPYHQGAQPLNPEALMRSRYSAYCLANIVYIQQTMSGKASEGFDPLSAKRWAEGVIWLGLEVRSSQMLSATAGQVAFVASFVEGKTVHRMHELSDFSLIDGRWYYVDGQSRTIDKNNTEISRNTLCPCGSEKKWKHCHGKPQL